MESNNIYEVTPQMLEKRPLSYSSLKAFRRSPAHFIQYRTEPKKEIPAFALGQAVETLLLDSSEIFNEKFLIADKPDLRKKDNKAFWEGIMEQASMNGQTLLSTEQYEHAKNAAASVMRVPEASIYIHNKKAQQRRLKWTDRPTGLPIIGYSDLEAEIGGVDFVVDIKTIGQSAEPSEFSRQASKFGYDLQIGSYLNGYHKRMFRFPEFVFIVVETAPPYGVAPIRVSKEDAELYKAEFQGLLKAFKLCMDKNAFHMTYEFFLYELRPYFQLSLPKYHELRFKNF